MLTLLEVARRGAKLGMLAPMLVQFEQQIDIELARCVCTVYRGFDTSLNNFESPRKERRHVLANKNGSGESLTNGQIQGGDTLPSNYTVWYSFDDLS